jgi:hypothetical protein
MNLVQKAVLAGGKLAPIVIPTESATGLMNPSVFVDDDGDILVNLRHVNYTLYHAEASQKFPSRWGPLSYLHPEKDQALRTINYLVRLDESLHVTDYTEVQMKSLHTPIWEFTGLEDARLMKWDGSYYLVGVRRDTTYNGQGRMEYSRIKLDKKKWTATETFRRRIPAPGANDSYCEKNWVPILDQPYHFVKWTSPTEVVHASLGENIPTETVFTKGTLTPPADQRGSSQVVRWGNMYLSITHEVNLYNNYLKQKDAVYRHRLCLFDDQMNLVGMTQPFAFLDAQVEFCAGAAVHDGSLLISFGFQDNAAFVLRVPGPVVEDMILEALSYED